MAMAAASSPALSSGATDTTSSAALPATNASRNLRGLNKPKCIKCGNVARSKCPYQSCKSCCSKAQNPCHIHVLKGNSTIPDSVTSSSIHGLEQLSASASPSGNSHRIASFRHLSNNFAQFNNLQSPIRSRKPLTRKDAALINEWRFSKLKEYKDKNVEVENEAFDRYMQNVRLLEEVFSVKSTMDQNSGTEDTADGGPSSLGGDTGELTRAALKLKLGSNLVRPESIRMRTEHIINQGLTKLRTWESKNICNDIIEQNEGVRDRKKQKSERLERAQTLSDLIERLSKARNEEDLRSCVELKSQLFTNRKANVVDSEDETSDEEDAKNGSTAKQCSVCSPQKWFTTTNTDKGELSEIDAYFSSLEEIKEL